MRNERRRKLIPLNKTKRQSFFIAFAILTVILGFFLFLNIQGFLGHKKLKALLIGRLVKAVHLPDDFNNSYPQSESAIYVLGGNEKSLKKRFKAAVSLYHQGAAKKIFILDKPGITEYDRSLKRNLTNNEWAIKKLAGLGVKKEDIEAAEIEIGFFGTLSEAKSIPKLIKKKGCRNLIVVTSEYHTMRTWASFSKFIADKQMNLFIYGSEDHAALIGLLFEYFKLIIYKAVLLK